MRKTFILFYMMFLRAAVSQAQVKNDFEGVYTLTGVMETASGFKLNKDSSFEFYYSYGALDRYGSGKWSFINNSIVLNSKTFYAKDFKITDSSLINKDFTTIKIHDENPAFYEFVHCLFKTPKGDTLLNTNEDGTIILPGKADTIKLLFELSPERISTFTNGNSKYNFYTFHFEPWALEVFFKNFVLRYSKEGLEGKHPLLTDKMYTYLKEKE